MSKIRLYLDEDVHPKIAFLLRERGFDAISAQEIEKREISDDKQLEFAISQDRVILTYNTGHFAKLHIGYIDTGRKHKGIIVSPQLPIGTVLHKLMNLLTALSAEEMTKRLEYLNNW